MRLEGRRAGVGTSFVDAFSEDVVLQVITHDDGVTQISFHLYDSRGGMVASSDGLQTFTEGIEIRDALNELLLLIPAEPGGNIEYRLYSRRGTLLTCSDGARTQLFGGIRLEPIKPVARTQRRGRFQPSGLPASDGAVLGAEGELPLTALLD
jgi:hypothetical protein